MIVRPRIEGKSYEADLAKRLSATTGRKVTAEQLKAWLYQDGGEGQAFVSIVIHDYLGDRVYKAVTRAGKLFVGVLEARLAGKKLTRIGREEIKL